MVHIYNGILLGHKKNEIMPFIATWMDLEIIILSEVSQREKDKYHMVSYDIPYDICIYHLYFKMIQINYKTEINSQT